MIFVLIFLFLCFVLEIIMLGLIFSSIVINIENLEMQGINTKTNVSSMIVSVEIYLYKIFKIVKIKFYKEYFKVFFIKFYYKKTFKYENNNQLSKMIFDMFKKNRIKIKKMKPEFESFKFDLNFGTEDAVITSLLTPTLSGAIVYLLRKFTKKLNKKDYEFKITPNYFSTNNFSIKFETKIKLITWELLKN